MKQLGVASAVDASVTTVGGFGIYIHWPFCTTKCPYCDFNSHVAEAWDPANWVDAYTQQIKHFAEVLPGRTLDSIFIGGGTPSLMPVALVEGILDTVMACWSTAPELEVTLEANPGSSDLARFQGYRRAGVNRISLGVQALDDGDLRRLGRTHSAFDALRAVDMAIATFPHVNTDLIYGRQFQSVSAWEAELRRVLSLKVEHLSLYQLTIEPETVFAKRLEKGHLPGLPEEQASLDLLEVTRQLCRDAGLANYEVSNWAAPGRESRHNLVYWQSGDYAAVGPGAHGRMTIQGSRYVVENTRQPGSWLDEIRNRKTFSQTMKKLSLADWAAEYLMMGMRLTKGISLQRYRALAGRDIDQVQILQLQRLGLIVRSGDNIRTTEHGRLLLNRVILDLLP